MKPNISSVEKLNKFILKHIQGVFGSVEMELFKEEVGKLEPGQVYLEIGVDEGRSWSVANNYAKEGVYIIGIDIADICPHSVSIGRGPYMAKVLEAIGVGKRGFFIHGDADEFSVLFNQKIDLLFIDGHHDYESVKNNTLKWEKKVKTDGVILFHDYDHPDTKRWLDEHYGDNKEVFGNKIVRVRV